MPVYKFRTLDEARRALVKAPADEALPQRIAGVWALADRLFRRRWPAGVYRYRSPEDADRQRREWSAVASRKKDSPR